jgi:hypothetical protein
MDFYISLFDDRADLNTLAKNKFVHEKHIIENYEKIGDFIPSGAKHFVVLMTLGYQSDEIVIRKLLDKNFKYFGVLGSRAKMTTLLKNLKKEGFPKEKLDKIHTPINDGKQLEKTLRDLAAHYPKVISTAIVPVALTRYNTDERLTRVTPEFCRRTISEVEKLQNEFRQNLGITFAFLGDEIYIKAGVLIPSRKHYGNYPQIEDGVGMIRSFLNSFESLLKKLSKTQRFMSEPSALADGFFAGNVRTHQLAIVPKTKNQKPKTKNQKPKSLNGTILTGEMFAPILREHIEKLNSLIGSELHVLAVPNTYFGGDVAVAGLLTGQDYLAIKEKIIGDFVIIPKHTIKSDEPILLDGMMFDELKSKFNVPIYDLDLHDLIKSILAGGF